MEKKFSNRKLHYWLGGISFLFVFVTTITGILWAYSPYMYWEQGYKKKQEPPSLIVQSETQNLISTSASFDFAKKCIKQTVYIQKITLVREVNFLVYQLSLVAENNKKHRLLLDASTGRCLSPLSRGLAIEFARQYISNEVVLDKAELLTNWVHRKKSKGRLAWKISFKDKYNTEIIIDPYFGNILEDQDDWRRLHWWVMKLHQFNFFGTHKVLTIISGLPVIILLISGIIMFWSLYKKKSVRRSIK